MTHVIACIDGSSAATPVCDYAAWAANRLTAPLTLLHVLDQSRYPLENDLSGNLEIDAREHLLTELAELDIKRNKLALEQGRLLLEAARKRAINEGIAEPILRQRHGDLVSTLADLESQTRLLVMGKQGEAHDGPSTIGDNVEMVVRSLDRPVLIAQGEFKAPERIMLAFDSSEVTTKGVRLLSMSPLFKGLPCHLVSVSADRQTLKEDHEWAERTLINGGHEVTTAILDGEIEPALHAYQKEHGIDMIVMGAYGHSRLREFFVGSTTNNMLRYATVPHLLLR